ncbi:MAG: tryptophan--tRNA ligase [Sulfurospirillaceae bacterium]|nr:tryptophan--tRNA ligase [Sulfurospirillaceae bacterium]MCK9546255.1 tryptophan--tRNA ligase [Sulfurospirillaceae bacterium]
MRTLTGLQPSGALHLGNYFGSIKQMLDAQEKEDLFIFIANYHALTSLKDGELLRQNTLDAAINFLSLGIDPNKSTFWVQSDVKEVLELYWVLSNVTPMGLLERAHSYKDKVAKGIPANHSLFSYPVLMAADILMYQTNVVPVGKDQVQHVEITRDLAIKFNNEYGEIFTIPEFRTSDEISTVPGLDGAKMSKSYNNTIGIFLNEKELKKACSSIVTDSTPLEEPKDPHSCNVFALAKLFLNEDEQDELILRYKSGKEGYGHFKMYLKELIWDYFEPHRRKREYYLKNSNEVKDILNEGAKKARVVARESIEKVREVVGIF